MRIFVTILAEMMSPVGQEEGFSRRSGPKRRAFTCNDFIISSDYRGGRGRERYKLAP